MLQPIPLTAYTLLGIGCERMEQRALLMLQPIPLMLQPYGAASTLDAPYITQVSKATWTLARCSSLVNECNGYRE